MRLLKEVQNLMASYHVKSGIYHFYRHEYKQAEEFLRKALKDPELVPSDRRNAEYFLTLSLLEQARTLRETGDFEGETGHLRRAAEVSPRYPDIRYRLGRALERLERLDEAVAEYREATACLEGYLDAQVALAFCLLKLGRHDEALTAFHAALAIRLRHLQEPFGRAVETLERGDAEAASELMHEVFRASPHLANECLKKALEFMRADEHERALAELNRALERNPRYPDLQNFRGVVLTELDRHEDAIDSFRLSVGLSPRYLVPRLNLAFTLARVGQYREAEAELEAALEIDPQEPAAKAKLDELRSGGTGQRRAANRSGAR